MSGLAGALVDLTHHLSGVLTGRTLVTVATTLEQPGLQEELDDLEGVVAEELAGLTVPEATLDLLRCAETLLDEHVPPATRPADTVAEAVVGLFDGLCHLRGEHGYGTRPDHVVKRSATRVLDRSFEDLRRAWPKEVIRDVTGLLKALDARIVTRLERLA